MQFTVIVDNPLAAGVTEILNNVTIADDGREINTGNNSSNEPTPVGLASLGGFVYVDLDNDGNFDPGEPPIPGVTITLMDSMGNTVDTMLTDDDGEYLFEDLVPGTYKLTETQPVGYASGINTIGDPGGDNAGIVNFEAGVVDDMFTNIELEVNDDGRNFNFGEIISKRGFLASS